jgi:hypothetical protein
VQDLYANVTTIATRKTAEPIRPEILRAQMLLLGKMIIHTSRFDVYASVWVITPEECSVRSSKSLKSGVTMLSVSQADNAKSHAIYVVGVNSSLSLPYSHPKISPEPALPIL